MTGELELQGPLKSEAVSGVMTSLGLSVRTTAVRLNCVEVMVEVISPIQLPRVVPEDALTLRVTLTGKAAS
jgi:hypothetical protein